MPSISKNVFREGLLLAHESAIDPNNALDPVERRRRAEEAMRRQMSDLGKRSGEIRRQRALDLYSLQKRAPREVLA